jgi:hypothetical protein
VDGTAANARPESNTANASANTKGTWVETFSATAFDAMGLDISPVGLGTNADRLVDIGIGAGGSELVIIPDLLVQRSGGGRGAHIFFPLKIPEGSRISHRSQATTGSATTLVGITLIAGGFVGHHASCSICKSYGPTAADSGGVSIDPGGTAGTKGAWVQVPTTTTTDPVIRKLVIAFGNQANTARAACHWLLDVAIGAGGSEQTILSNLHIKAETNNMMEPPFIGALPVVIPAGSQISARASCSITDATDRTFDIAFYGLS